VCRPYIYMCVCACVVVAPVEICGAMIDRLSSAYIWVCSYYNLFWHDSNPTDLRIIWFTDYQYINTLTELICKIWVIGQHRTLIICMKTHFNFCLTIPTSLLVSCWNMLVIDSDCTLIGVFATFPPLYYVQKQYYKYFNALSPQRRHSEDDNVTFYCVKMVEDARPIPIKPYTY